MHVDIIDIGSGNIRSITNWIERLNIPTRIVSNPEKISSELVVLPGVGSAGPYMKRLKATGFDQAVINHAQQGKRLLGICLGFQLLGNHSEEDGGVNGLGLIDGVVERLDHNNSHNEWEQFQLRLDKLGKNSFNATRKLSRKRIINGRVFFNHEYGFINKDQQATSFPIQSEKHQRYSSMIIKDNIIGIQFHPEKSQRTGLDLISMIL